MTKNPFFQPNPADPGAYLVTPAGTILLCSDAIHDAAAAPAGRARAGRVIREVLAAARAAGYAQGEVAETVLLDYGQAVERKKAVALELAQAVGTAGFIDALHRAGWTLADGR